MRILFDKTSSESRFRSINFLIIRKSFKYLAVLNLVLLTFVIYESLFAKNYWQGSGDKRFKVEPGRNLDQVIYALKSEDIIKSPLIFKMVAKISGKEDVIISKSHLFKNGMTNPELLRLLTDPYAYESVSFTVPPGYSIRQISRLIERKLSLSGKKFTDEASNDSLIALIGMNGKVKDLEGFLFPDTYNVSASMNEEDIVHMMFNEFRKKVFSNSQIQTVLKQSGTSLLDAVTLASIIEAESLLENEKPVISGVYHNRLKRGMRLEADPTVQYALPDGPKARLLYEDLKIESSYNTYRNRGLPPGPINNPGLSAIKAAITPQQHDYLFFVARGDGAHIFSSTYQQHQNAVREYRAKMRRLSEQKKDTAVKPAQ